jgi:hypothetical protein
LSSARDATILIDAGARLRLADASAAEIEAIEALGALLTAHAAKVGRREVGDRRVLPQADRMVRKARRRAGAWSKKVKGFRSLKKGLLQSYAQAREAYLAAQADPSVEHCHQWRQQTKHVRFQVGLLSAVDPEAIGALTDHAKKLGDHLGEDHDLAMLDDWLVRKRRPLLPKHRGIIDALVARRRTELCAQAMHLGEQFFADSPRKFVRRLERSWKARRPSGRGPATA